MVAHLTSKTNRIDDKSGMCGPFPSADNYCSSTPVAFILQRLYVLFWELLLLAICLLSSFGMSFMLQQRAGGGLFSELDFASLCSANVHTFTLKHINSNSLNIYHF